MTNSSQSDIGRIQLRRVNAFQGLMIDAAVWRDAHEYHRSQMRLHNLSLHGWGIAHGLEVTLAEERNTLVVNPGIAIDPSGNFVVVTDPYVHRVESTQPATIHLLIQFSEVPAGPTQPPDDPHGQPTRVLEAYRIRQTSEPPSGPALELCRLAFDPLAGPIALPEDPTNPDQNQVDTRFRAPIGAAGPLLPAELPADWGWTTEPVVARTPAAAAGAAAAVAGGAVASRGRTGAAAIPSAAPAVQRPINLCVARHSGQGWDAHAAGLQVLARELGATGRPLDVRDAALGPDTDSADVIYLTGYSRMDLGQDERAALGRALERGAVVIGDGCAASPRGDAGAREFSVSFTQLLEELGRHLESVTRGHPALSGRHLFALVPPGGRESTVLLGDAAGGALCCDADYGCAWNGGAPERPLTRSAIRDALELGVNFVTLGTLGK